MEDLKLFKDLKKGDILHFLSLDCKFHTRGVVLNAQKQSSSTTTITVLVDEETLSIDLYNYNCFQRDIALHSESAWGEDSKVKIRYYYLAISSSAITKQIELEIEQQKQDILSSISKIEVLNSLKTTINNKYK